MTQGLSILTGCSAGATEAVVVVPFESVPSRSLPRVTEGLSCLSYCRLVKIRLQDKSSSYAGPLDVIKKIVQQEGVFGMYQGMESTFWRCAISSQSNLPGLTLIDA